jgi:hypothetical protein
MVATLMTPCASRRGTCRAEDRPGGGRSEQSLGGDGDGDSVIVDVQLDLVQHPRADRWAPAEVFAAEQIDP